MRFFLLFRVLTPRPIMQADFSHTGSSSIMIFSYRRFRQSNSSSIPIPFRITDQCLDEPTLRYSASGSLGLSDLIRSEFLLCIGKFQNMYWSSYDRLPVQRLNKIVLINFWRRHNRIKALVNVQENRAILVV